jgi:hypothetical protein
VQIEIFSDEVQLFRVAAFTGLCEIRPARLGSSTTSKEGVSKCYDACDAHMIIGNTYEDLCAVRSQ